MIEIRQVAVRPDGSTIHVSAQGMSITAERGMFTGISVRDWKRMIADTWYLAGLYWHKHMLPKHFTHAGATEYGYQPRNFKYERYKLKRFGHTYPLVFSGDLKRQTMRVRDVRFNSKGARIILHGPTYLYQYRKSRKEPDKAAELSAVSTADVQVIERLIDRELTAMANETLAGRTAAIHVTDGHAA